MERGNVSNLIRAAGLLQLADYIRFQVLRARNLPRNRDYRMRNPSIVLPPDYLLYESFAIDYKAYYEGGKETAKYMFDILSKHKSSIDLNILDWGCGPGRIVRHMPDYFNQSSNIYGTDYNAKSINWCRSNLPKIEFSLNSLSPPMKYPDEFFDVIYGISIFTHLSEEMHYAWLSELDRVLKKNGVLLLTTAGKSFSIKLTKKEKVQFNNGDLVARAKVKEGHRIYSAFQPVSFMQKLFSEFEIIRHIEREPVKNYIPQDIWIVKKKFEYNC